MTKMVMGDIKKEGEKDPPELSVCEPCIGTGRMLMEASNYSVNLWGADIYSNLENLVIWARLKTIGFALRNEKALNPKH